MGTVFKTTPDGPSPALQLLRTRWAESRQRVGLGTDGNFYGTTTRGGVNNVGTVFKITPAGVLTKLYDFTAADPTPHGGVVLGKNGKFYGATCDGSGPWTGYSITPAGKFKHLTNTIPPCPFSGLILGRDGNFYGASQVGGLTYQGTVFKMTPAGGVKILYSFDYAHGAYLYSPVVQGNDGFSVRHDQRRRGWGGGVVFRMATTGKKFSLLREFDSRQGTDGSTPFAGLVAATDGNLYGAT